MFSPHRLLLAVMASATIYSARADVFLEVDFQNYNEASRLLSAIVSKSGAATDLVVSEFGATVDPDGATEINSANPKLQKGYGECMAESGGGGCFQTPFGPTGGYSRYINARGYGTVTVALLFKPHFGGPLSGSGSQRSWFFTTNYRGTSPAAITLSAGRELILGFGIGPASSPKKRVTISPPNWDPSKWYFIAASWSPSQKPTIYWREVAAENGQFSIAADSLEDIGESIGRGIRLGNTGVNDGALLGDAPMNGKMAYFVMMDQYTDSVEAYDELYREIVSPN